MLNEQHHYNDLFILNILDSYQNNTLKVLMAEDIFVLANATTPFVLLGDDDTCINVLKIMKELLMTAPTSLHTIGKCIYNKIGSEEPHSKHGVSLLAMPSKIMFTQANAMILTNDLLYAHVRLMRTVPALTHIDDGQLGVFNHLAGSSYKCLRFVRDLRKENPRSLILHVPEYSVHYCKKSSIMNFVCKGVNQEESL